MKSRKMEGMAKLAKDTTSKFPSTFSKTIKDSIASKKRLAAIDIFSLIMGSDPLSQSASLLERIA